MTVVGFDELPSTLQLIDEGVIAATLSQAPERQSYEAVRMLLDAINGKKVSDVDTGIQVIDKSNLKDYMITPTPEPGTAAPPELTDGTNIWRLTSFSTTRLEFQCVTKQSPPWPVRAGQPGPDYTKLYVTDSEGKRYQATQIGLTMLGTSAQECSTFEIIFEAMPEDRQGMQLHFADLPPIDLSQ